MAWITHFKPIEMNREFVRDLVFAYLRNPTDALRQHLSEIIVPETGETVLEVVQRAQGGT